MLTFKQLGHNGRLGNQMFQLAMLLAVARKRGYEFCLPKENLTNPPHRGFYLPTFFNIPENWFVENQSIEGTHHYVQTWQRGFGYNPEVFDVPANTEFFGYFQSYKYFQDIAQEVRNLYTFKSEIWNKCWEVMEPYQEQKTVSVHVRRTDYFDHSQIFPVVPGQYYYDAYWKLFPDNDAHVFIFSDDIKWCRKYFRFKSMTFMDRYKDYEDLCMMTMCKHNIVGNSTFGWWGAWLNQNLDKKVCLPVEWFCGDSFENSFAYQLKCDGWTLL